MFLIAVIIIYQVIQEKTLKSFLSRHAVFLIGLVVCSASFFMPYVIYSAKCIDDKIICSYSLVSDKDRNVVIASGYYKDVSILYEDESGMKHTCILTDDMIYEDEGTSRLEIWQTKLGFLKSIRKKVYINN